MSGNLAIAAVSAVMKYVLQNPSVSSDSIAAVIPDLAITVLPPHKVDVNTPTINIFFQRAMVNPGWAQNNLPSRNSAGTRISNPYLALDLTYLLTMHSTLEYHGELLLGYAMQRFHETPVFPRSLIRDALSSPAVLPNNLPPALLTAIAAADLAEQIEQIRLTPHYPAPEEQSNLWSAIGTGYVPTAYYCVSVVLIESRRPTRSAPPVRQYNLYALPFKQIHIQDVVAAAGTNQPIFTGSRVIVRGNALRGDDTRVLLGGVERTAPQFTAMTNEQIVLDLPTGLRAGINGAQIKHMLQLGTPPTDHRGLESNVVAFVLQPRITGPAPTYDITFVPAAGGNPSRLEIGIAPEVGAAQRALVLLNEINAPATRAPVSFTVEANAHADTTTLLFDLPNVPSGTYLVRVRVDGAESPLDYVDPNGYQTPQVTIP